MRLLTLSAALLASAVASTAGAADQRNLRPDGRLTEVARWADRLTTELEHLQEDIVFEWGRRSGVLQTRVDETLGTALHFQRVVNRSADRQHVVRDFRNLDDNIHELLRQLDSSRHSWLRRGGARIRYADEQLHYLLASGGADGEGRGEIIARLAHVLESESRQLAQVAERERERGRVSAGLERMIQEFADEAAHFHQAVERGADTEHLHNDFAELDSRWHRLVDYLNRSNSSTYVRLSAQRVSAVDNQLHEILSPRGGEPGVAPPSTGRRPGDVPPPRRRQSSEIEFNIPGIGSFRLN